MTSRTLANRKRRSITANFRNAGSVKQRGIVLVLIAVSMLAVLAVAGLALDMSHALLTKTRLQNTVDASALAAAHVLNDTLSESQATQAARDVFLANQGAAGNGEMSTYADAANAVVEYSATRSPFSPGSGPAEYVRVTYTDLPLPSWIIQLVGVNSTNISASAVSGPSPTLDNVCNLLPIVVCGDPAVGGSFGYNVGDVTVLKGMKSNKSNKSNKSCKSNKSGKSGKSGKSESCSEDDSLGPGNFGLAQLGGNGSNLLKESLAGTYMGCAQEAGTVETLPGNRTGPTAKGINTRFGTYKGSLKQQKDLYLPDVIVQEQDDDLEYDANSDEITLDNDVVEDSSDLDFNYDDYEGRISAENYDYTPGQGGYPDGAFGRRNVSVIIADCSGVNNGQGTIPILGFGCFFLLQQVSQQGNESEIFAEFVEICDARGSFGSDASNDPGPFKIQLYDDPARNES
jgi:Flp pilus assembly protein TadG